MVVISHGDKGGTGKSMLSAILVDYLLAEGRKVAILEGDLGQPDIALRFAQRVAVGAVNLNQAGATEAAVAKFGEWLEAQTAQSIVVNLPAGAGDTLDSLADVLVSVAESLGHALTVVYSVGAYETSTQGLLRSWENGILGQARYRFIALPEFLGDPRSFHWMKCQSERERMLMGGGKEVRVPALRPDALRDTVLSLPGPFSELVSSAGLSLTEKAMLKRWLMKAHDLAALLCEGRE
ncbi:MAG: hypothetical protein WBX11_04170 [Thiobacillaceae bacterium]